MTWGLSVQVLIYLIVMAAPGTISVAPTLEEACKSQAERGATAVYAIEKSQDNSVTYCTNVCHTAPPSYSIRQVRCRLVPEQVIQREERQPARWEEERDEFRAINSTKTLQEHGIFRGYSP